MTTDGFYNTFGSHHVCNKHDVPDIHTKTLFGQGLIQFLNNGITCCLNTKNHFNLMNVVGSGSFLINSLFLEYVLEVGSFSVHDEFSFIRADFSLTDNNFSNILLTTDLQVTNFITKKPELSNRMFYLICFNTNSQIVVLNDCILEVFLNSFNYVVIFQFSVFNLFLVDYCINSHSCIIQFEIGQYVIQCAFTDSVC